MAICVDNRVGTETVWSVCHNNNDIWHLSEVQVGQVCRSGQPFHEQFVTEELAIARIPEEYRYN